MIFYFTGTGNSRWVAEALGTAFDEPLVSIADALNEGKNAYPLGEREKVFYGAGFTSICPTDPLSIISSVWLWNRNGKCGQEGWP